MLCPLKTKYSTNTKNNAVVCRNTAQMVAKRNEAGSELVLKGFIAEGGTLLCSGFGM